MKVNSNDIIEIIKSEVDSSIDFNNLKNDLHLTDQGIDSLDINAVLLSVEEKYEIEIPDEDLNNLTTINNIVKYINDKK